MNSQANNPFGMALAGELSGANINDVLKVARQLPARPIVSLNNNDNQMTLKNNFPITDGVKTRGERKTHNFQALRP